MGISWSIRLKAMLLLVAFAANFTVFCHCATAQKKHCCCEKQTKTKPCNSAQAVKFNLAEKQVADPILAAPLPVIVLEVCVALAERTPLPTLTAVPSFKHPPPDILALHQRLVI